MTTTEIVLAIGAWLALQVPIGVALGWYIRRARTLIAPEPLHATARMHRTRRQFSRYTPPAALLRG
jgi:Leu/Phe-tRNA-protein transferase